MKICHCGKDIDRKGSSVKYCWSCYQKLRVEQKRIIGISYSVAVRRLKQGRL